MTIELHHATAEGERVYVLLLGRVTLRLRVQTLSQLSRKARLASVPLTADSRKP